MTKRPLSGHSIVAHCSEAVSCDVGDTETVILDLSSGVYYRLDAVGTTIWDLLRERPRSVDGLVDLLVATHEVERERCRRDALAFVDDLTAAKLVEVSDGPAG